MHCARKAIEDETWLAGCHILLKVLWQETDDNVIRQQLALAHQSCQLQSTHHHHHSFMVSNRKPFFWDCRSRHDKWLREPSIQIAGLCKQVMCPLRFCPKKGERGTMLYWGVLTHHTSAMPCLSVLWSPPEGYYAQYTKPDHHPCVVFQCWAGMWFR